MKQAFFALWYETHDILKKFYLNKDIISTDFKEKQGKNGHVLKAGCFVNEAHPLVECRIVSIQGPNTDVINTMIFPLTRNIPIFAAELLAFGKKRLAFIDLQVPGIVALVIEQVKHKTGLVVQNYQHLPREKDVPEWAIAHTAGYYFFSRFAEQDELEKEIIKLYLDYLQIWLLFLTDKKDSPICNVEEHAIYKEHHLQHSPGPKFLGQIFGEDWSREFLQGFLYR